MKIILSIYFLFIALISSIGQTTTYNVRLSSSQSGNDLLVTIEVSFNESNGFGTSNIVLNYNSLQLGTPIIEGHSFTTGYINTNLGTSTNRVSLNTEYNYGGSPLSITTSLSEVATLRFPISLNMGSAVINVSNSTEIFTSTDVKLNPGSIQNLNSPLPISLHTFSAKQHSERASKLDWKTSSEINSAYFGIERSRDGDTWETIGKVSAAGNSHTELTYEYIDDRLPFSRTADQIYYYRLRLTDQDGSHKYSDIKAVNFSRKTSDGIAIYPNPSTQMVHLDISTMDASAGDIDLRIYDIHGRIMADKTIIGAGIEPIDVTQYPTGTYQVSVTQGNTQHQKRFIKIE
jgi:hypothetical protein